MKRHGNFIRRLLFKSLSFENYLRLLSKLYFLSFNTGLLRINRLFDYPYFLDKLINKGDVCLDIGANLGYFTVPFSKIVGAPGKVYAVEPVKPVLSVLKRNTRNLKNVEIYPFALGKEDKRTSLVNNVIKTKGFIATGSYFISDQNLAEAKNAEIEFDAEMKKGSELFAHLDRLDFIKCDIEGYEVIVIPELEPVILKHHPIVLIESRRESRIQMLQFFKKHNFSAFVLKNGELFPAQKDEFWDILFVPQDKLNRVSRYIAKLPLPKK